MFYKLRQDVPPDCLKLMYNALVFTHLLYGVEVYANTCRTHLNKIIVLNNKIIRIMLKKDIRTPVAQLYKSINSLTINDLHEMQLLIIIYKWLYYRDILPASYQNYFIVKNVIHSYNVRRINDLFVPRCCSKLGQRYSVYRGSIFWNMLPDYLKVFTEFHPTYLF